MTASEGRGYWDASVGMTPAAQQVHSGASLSRPYEDSPLDLTLFVATANDAEHIARTLATIADALSALEFSCEIVVIDDASRDATAELVREFMVANPELSIVLRCNTIPKGVAQNYYDAAFIGKGKYFRMLYGDTAETMETLVDVLRAVGEADILIPYYIDSLHRETSGQDAVRIYANVLNFFSAHPLKDYSLPAVHLRHNVMRWHGNITGPGFQVDLLCRLLDMGFTYKQMPSRSIERHPTRLSRSTIGYNFLSLGHTVLRILFRRMMTPQTEQ
jgi:glycosyltransferase involved in cell wall biosynthesis